MNECRHNKWECQLFYGSEGTQIYCEVTCETCQKVARASSVSHDGKTLIVKPQWDDLKKYGGETGYEI